MFMNIADTNTAATTALGDSAGFTVYIQAAWPMPYFRCVLFPAGVAAAGDAQVVDGQVVVGKCGQSA
jgi:hypothetical protein